MAIAKNTHIHEVVYTCDWWWFFCTVLVQNREQEVVETSTQEGRGVCEETIGGVVIKACRWDRVRKKEREKLKMEEEEEKALVDSNWGLVVVNRNSEDRRWCRGCINVKGGGENVGSGDWRMKSNNLLGLVGGERKEERGSNSSLVDRKIDVSGRFCV